ncbi:unnamed protein product [Cuscuta campestris]|uniref:Uncharacterized protein n=1 Tax=Cuscuta campestris TaxID=132261 RepID=A0A484L0G6_9ASTE|nr:unnamed protein product [Cuscuta campestris]
MMLNLSQQVFQVGASAEGQPNNLNMNQIVQTLEAMRQFFQEEAPRNPKPPAWTVDSLKKNGAKEFVGAQSDEGENAEFWLDRIICVLTNMLVPEQHQVRLTLALLQDDAYYCWSSVPGKPEPHYGLEPVSTPKQECTKLLLGMNSKLMGLMGTANTDDFKILWAQAQNAQLLLNTMEKENEKETSKPIPSGGAKSAPPTTSHPVASSAPIL